jgi:hypothetical protein
MSTIAQNAELLKTLNDLLSQHRGLFKQERVYERVVEMVLGEVMSLGRHTVTQVAWSLGENESDISAYYRVFSQGRFDASGSSNILLKETLAHTPSEMPYVVAGDGTQTPRTGRHIPGTGWLRNPRTPAFKVGIHRAQRWFNGVWLTPPDAGYSRAIPLKWLPAFPEKAASQDHPACKEWEAAHDFLGWVRAGLDEQGRVDQPLLMVADGNYDTVGLWQGLPERTIVLARSAKNRVLYHPLPADAHGNRQYGQRADTPQQVWQTGGAWSKTTLTIRGRQRQLQYRVRGPVFRKGAPDTPLFLIVVRGQSYSKHGRRKYRDPVPYLVNAVQDQHGNWQLPLDAPTLIFWAWQRWEIEVCHREMKSNFGLGDKQCWNTHAAIASVQWSAWVYSILLLAAYRVWGLTHGPPVPTRWWRGSGRWSFNTLWRTIRSALWATPRFYPSRYGSIHNLGGNWTDLTVLPYAVYAATPL